MNTQNMDALIDDLLALLDAEAAGLEIILEHLNELRAGMIKHNEARLAQLLSNIQSQKDERDAIENKRNNLRHNLALRMGCLPEQVNLSRIIASLPHVWHSRILQRKQLLSRLIEKLKSEYTATAILLSECSRFNRMLLDNILGNRCKNNITTYNANGKMKRPSGSGFIAMQF